MKDPYAEIARQIVTAIERGNVGEWRMPWHRTGAASSPINAITKEPYRGVNVLTLWSAADAAGFHRCEWATYRQWNTIGAQVRKGEKSSMVAFWKFLKAESSDDDADGGGNDAAAPSDGPASPEPPPGPWGPHNS